MAEPAALRDAVGPGDNVLVLAPAIGSREAEACGALLGWGPPDSVAYVGVTFTRAAATRLDVWLERVSETLPARTVIVGVDALQPADGARPAAAADWELATVTDPADLTGIGMRVSDVLSDWRDLEAQLVACVHSLTTLLQYTTTARVFRFLHVLTARLAAVDAVSHFHLDPDAHERRTVSRLEQLFDAVAEADETAGGWQVRHR